MARYFLGVGQYGHQAQIDRLALKKPTLILGVPRSGKTRLACSLCSQEVRNGAGALIIDYKADPKLVAHYADLAEETGRTLLHFTLTSKAMSAYRPVHPYMADNSALYDPLSRGNGSSKAEMLLGAADREGDAAAYLRRALEVVQLTYDVASLTGYDRGRGGFDVISNMLDLEFLTLQAESLTPQMVLRQFPQWNLSQAADRVERLKRSVVQKVASTRGDQVLRGAIGDTKSWAARWATSPAIGGTMVPGPAEHTIDLARAILRSEIVVFSLDTQSYPLESAAIGNMVLLDMANAVATLRGNKDLIAQRTSSNVDASSPDATPWPPFVLQIEEFGSAKNEVILNLLNKSSAEGIRVLLSSQSWDDLVAVDDGKGVWAGRVSDQLDNIFSFQGTSATGADLKLSEFSGTVVKTRPQEQVSIRKANIFGLGRSAGRVLDGRTVPAEEPRIPAGTVQNLNRDRFEFLWVTKAPQLRAVHTVPEGPNRWYETLRFVGVQELPIDWSLDDMTPDEIEQARTAGQQSRQLIAEELADPGSLTPMVVAAQQLDDTGKPFPAPAPPPPPTQPQPNKPDTADTVQIQRAARGQIQPGQQKQRPPWPPKDPYVDQPLFNPPAGPPGFEAPPAPKKPSLRPTRKPAPATSSPQPAAPRNPPTPPPQPAAATTTPHSPLNGPPADGQNQPTATAADHPQPGGPQRRSDRPSPAQILGIDPDAPISFD